MGVFKLSKWYMDCVGDAGDAIIAYAAELRWRSITLHYASVLVHVPGQEPRTTTTMRASPDPLLEADVLRWSSPALGVSGEWTSLSIPVDKAIFESEDGDVTWRCLMPRARAAVTLGDRVVRGLGYAEHVVLTIEPWRMPIDELRWGRFVGERTSLVWIDWRGGSGKTSKRIVLLDGEDVGDAAVEDRSVVSAKGDVRLVIEDGSSLRRGEIGKTALARVPGIELFPTRILAVDEEKWCARATLDDANGRDQGWVIHEVVRWPESAVVDSAGVNTLGKALYGLLFAVLLPALLVLWARSTEAVVPAPPLHLPSAGIGLFVVGVLLMVAGWMALWRHGGGLPMNAFPPPRLVTRGVYAIVAHPIYVGFALACFGASIATGSASGLWLVSPTVVLAAIALVYGYEAHDLDTRFGRDLEVRGTPWLALPAADDAPPHLARRLSAFAMATLPWIALGAVRSGESTWVFAGVYVLALTAPFAVRRQRDLRAFVAHSLLAMPLVLPLHLLVPSVTPSFHVLLALLAADAWSSRARRALGGRSLWVGRMLAIAVASGDLAQSRAGLSGVFVSVVAYIAVANADALWRWLRALCERIANSWRETRIGPVRIINHGVWALLASFGGIVIIGTCLGPGHFVTIVVGASGGLIGAGLWAQTIEGSAALSRPYGFYGGLLGICLAGLFAPLLGTPMWLLLGSVAVSAPFIQGVGRLRCFVQGCCHGREASPAVGIRYRHPRSRVCRLAHLDDVPLHATQLYSILWNVVTFVIVVRLWSLHAALHLIGGVYFVLNGLGRFCEESYRGEPQTPTIARLRLYQWVALCQAIVGAVLTAVGTSGPAPDPRLNVAGVIAAAIFAPIYWFALGVDFPESNRRLSRLA